LLDFGPGYVVNGKRGDDIAIARDIDRLAPERLERDETAEFIAARSEDLRAPAMVKSYVA
jgi:hypothetical protein